MNNHYVDYVLSDWKTLNKIAELLRIDSDDIFEKIFKERKIVKQHWWGNSPFIYMTVFKEDKDG